MSEYLKKITISNGKEKVVFEVASTEAIGIYPFDRIVENLTDYDEDEVIFVEENGSFYKNGAGIVEDGYNAKDDIVGYLYRPSTDVIFRRGSTLYKAVIDKTAEWEKYKLVRLVTEDELPETVTINLGNYSGGYDTYEWEDFQKVLPLFDRDEDFYNGKLRIVVNEGRPCLVLFFSSTKAAMNMTYINGDSLYTVRTLKSNGKVTFTRVGAQ